MRRGVHKPPEPDDPLCCCEYVDRKGGRSHVAACCCDCQELDEACDRWLKREPQQEGSLSRVADTVADRLRVPWLRGGARRVDLSLLPPLVLLPVLLRIAALHVFLGVVVLTTLPGLVLWYYYFTHRKKGRTLFFLSLALFSLAYMYFLFVTEIVPRGDVTPPQVVVVTTGVVLTLVALVNTKRGPGYVRPCPSDTHSTVTYHSTLPEKDSAHLNGARHQVVIANRGAALEPSATNGVVAEACSGVTDSRKKQWCSWCKLLRPLRAGHCRICGACIQRLDHHCVWINSCVGRANHRSFLLTLLLFLVTSLYGIVLVLRTLCPRQHVMLALLYCPGVYSQYSSALCFTCAWYSTIVTCGLCHLLLLQLINVSVNVTEREARIALRERSGRSLLGGLVIDTGTYSHGFRNNWAEFLTMHEKTEDRVASPPPTELV
ncbi:palmitoyltransferase ZDHHC23-B [Engraulis encrasicolus]|uniref:palmitoyltransferase ZDHHC23-B n=1 Tax=Engraulis encrasicolus TaxID=184585 RepID=UPI002FD2B467